MAQKTNGKIDGFPPFRQSEGIQNPRVYPLDLPTN